MEFCLVFHQNDSRPATRKVETCQNSCLQSFSKVIPAASSVYKGNNYTRASFCSCIATRNNTPNAMDGGVAQLKVFSEEFPAVSSHWCRTTDWVDGKYPCRSRGSAGEERCVVLLMGTTKDHSLNKVEWTSVFANVSLFFPRVLRPFTPLYALPKRLATEEWFIQKL